MKCGVVGVVAMEFVNFNFSECGCFQVDCLYTSAGLPVVNEQIRCPQSTRRCCCEGGVTRLF